MARQIIIEVDYGPGKKPDTYVHRVYCFNDALYYLAENDEWMSFSLDQIDKLNGQRIDVKSARKLRRVLAKVERLINEQGLAGIARPKVIASSN